jgi:hypothetical protein
LIQEEIKRRLNSSNACYQSVHNFLFFSSAVENWRNENIKTIILPEVLYDCEIWSLKLRVEHRLRMFENMLLRRIFGPKRDGVTGGWRKLHNEDFMICTLRQE